MINSDIFRPLVALGFGFCFGASFYFLSYYKSYRSIQDQFKEDVPDKIEEKSSLILEKSDSGCCQTEQSSPCCQTEKDTSSCCQTQQETACCQGEEEIPCADTSACCQTDGKTSAGCGTGESCCGTGSTNTTGKNQVTMQKKVERFGYNRDLSDRHMVGFTGSGLPPSSQRAALAFQWDRLCFSISGFPLPVYNYCQTFD